MCTAYTVNFDTLGNITSIASTSSGNTRKDIKHPVKDDTFTFVKPTTATWTALSILSTNPNIPSNDLFGSATVTAGDRCTVVYTGGTTVTVFEFTPAIAPASGPSPDTGTIKVGG